MGVNARALFNDVLPAIRGHIGIRSADLTELARDHGLTPPAGYPAARGPEWVALTEALAGVAPLAAAAGPPRLMPVLRDLADLVEGSVEPVAWWQRLLGSGANPPAADARRHRTYQLLGKLANEMPVPPDLARALLGRLDGALLEADTRELADLLADIGEDTWLAWSSGCVNREAWPVCYAALLGGAREATDRGLGLLYGAGY